MSSARVARVPVRGTQSFVHTLSACWHRPSFTVVEVLWRWAYGIPALLLVGYEADRIVRAAPVDASWIQRLSLFDLGGTAEAVQGAVAPLVGPVLQVAKWLVPLLVVGWAVASAVGRTALLRRVDPALHSRAGTLVVLHLLRAAALGGTLAVWFFGLRVDAHVAIGTPLAAGNQPSPVLYCALVIVETLALFTVWNAANWGLSAAPLIAMRTNLGAGASLAAALRLGPLKGKFIEVNLVMGIVKIALIVLAMVFSASPLPFESVATPQFMMWWYAAVTVLYLVASGFFHVVHLVGYLDLWREYDVD